MKYFVLFSLSLLFLSCTKKTEAAENFDIEDTVVVTQKEDSANVWISKNKDFLNKFRQIELDSTKFIAPDYSEKNIGKPLSKEELLLFPEDLNYQTFTGDYNDFEAVSRFEINENTIGLVARMPGEYSFTSLKLFFYDKKSDAMLPKYFELADKLGDAGYSEEIKSWVWKENNQLKSFSYLWTSIEPIEPDDPTRPSRTDDYYLIKLSPEKFDTVRVSTADLPKFKKLLTK